MVFYRLLSQHNQGSSYVSSKWFYGTRRRYLLDRIDIGYDNGKILLFTFHWIYFKADFRTVIFYFWVLFC